MESCDIKQRLLKDWAKYRQIEFDLMSNRKPSQQHVYVSAMHKRDYISDLLTEQYGLKLEDLESAVREVNPSYTFPTK